MPASIKFKVVRDMLNEALSQLDSLEKENAELRNEIEILNSESMPEVLSIKFITEYLGVSSGTVSEWLTTGYLKGNKKGGRWFVMRDTFKKWLNDEPKLKLAK